MDATSIVDSILFFAILAFAMYFFSLFLEKVAMPILNARQIKKNAKLRAEWVEKYGESGRK